MTARDLIVARLAQAPAPLALHELDIVGVSQTSASARLRELAREGIVQSVPVPGKRYTAWRLAPKDLTLFDLSSQSHKDQANRTPQVPHTSFIGSGIKGSEQPPAANHFGAMLEGKGGLGQPRPLPDSGETLGTPAPSISHMPH